MIRAVMAYVVTQKMLLLEYLDGHVNLTREGTSEEVFGRVTTAVKEWLKEAGIRSTYDLCANNIMMGPASEVVLVDFEMALGGDKL